MECQPFSSITTGSVECSNCLPTDPRAGTFVLSLPTISTYQPARCLIKKMSGTLTINFDNGVTVTAVVGGHFIDEKGVLRGTGQIAVSSLVDWAYEHAGVAISPYPQTPCVETTNPVSAVLVFST